MFKIGSKKIGEGYPCYIIAEAGRNHNGSVELGKKLIKAAKEAGANAVKFQSIRADTLIVKDAGKISHVKANVKNMSAYEVTKSVEMSEQMHRMLKNYATSLGIEFLSTPEDYEMADLLDELGVRAFKTGSLDLLWHDFLVHIAKKKKPMIISTGMATMEEIKEAVNLVKRFNQDIALLHCVSAYPPKRKDLNLTAIRTLKNEFSNLPIGYSDHSTGTLAPVAAVAMGANIIEKHFTLDWNLPGEDHKMSLEPNQFKDMVRMIREVEEAFGSGIKRPTPSEIEMREKIRRKLVANYDIPEGTPLAFGMVGVKIAGKGGLEADKLLEIIGMTTKIDIAKDTKIMKEMLV